MSNSDSALLNGTPYEQNQRSIRDLALRGLAANHRSGLLALAFREVDEVVKRTDETSRWFLRTRSKLNNRIVIFFFILLEVGARLQFHLLAIEWSLLF
jgi:hypothetical protein